MDRKTVSSLKRFKEALEAHGIEVERIIVYGSHAQGRAEIHSDIDVAVISNSFRRLNLLRRLEVLGAVLARAGIMAPIEALGYTEAEFNSKEKGTLLSDEIKIRGKTVRL